MLVVVVETTVSSAVVELPHPSKLPIPFFKTTNTIHIRFCFFLNKKKNIREQNTLQSRQ